MNATELDPDDPIEAEILGAVAAYEEAVGPCSADVRDAICWAYQHAPSWAAPTDAQRETALAVAKTLRDLATHPVSLEMLRVQLLACAEQLEPAPGRSFLEGGAPRRRPSKPSAGSTPRREGQAMDERRFPLLWPDRRKDVAALEALGCPRDVPWSLVQPHEQRAKLNHDQTLERLAERGGLSPFELAAVLTDRPWWELCGMPMAEYVGIVLAAARDAR